MVNSTLPRLSCHTCKNKFHSGTALRFPLLRACLSSLLQAHPIQRATHTRTTKKQTKQENTQTRVDVLGGREHAQMYLSTYALMNTAMPLCTSAPLPALLHLALPPPSLTPLCVPGFLPRAARCCAAFPQGLHFLGTDVVPRFLHMYFIKIVSSARIGLNGKHLMLKITLHDDVCKPWVQST